jgi:hypothetical protein
MQVVGDPKYKGVTLTRIQVVNLGRRPVTITTMGAIALHPNRKDLVAIDTNPTLPCELSEGKYVTSLWPQSDLDFSRIDYWAAWDSKGNIHKLREASLLKHWKSEFGWRRELRRKRAASSSL